MLRSLGAVASLAVITAQGRVSPGTVVDDSPLVVIYYDNWAGWIREFSPSHVEKNFLSREMPVRNFVFNYAFFTWNPQECSLISVDTIDLQKGDQGGWTPDDWTIDSTESWATSKPMGGHLPAFMLLKSKYPHIKLLPSIGGWSRSHTFHDCLINKMDHMVSSVVDHVTVWGWDGIDLDWEYPNCDGAPCGCQGEATCTVESQFSNVAGAGDWERYKVFVNKVRSAFNDLEDKLNRRLYITAALGMTPKLIDGGNAIWSSPTPIEWICEEDDFDWVNLMTYDFYGPWSPLTGPLAPLFPNPNVAGDQMSIDDSLQRILKRCSAPHKLTMGLATYGKTWQSVPKEGTVPGLWAYSTASDVRSGGTWELGTISYFDIKKNLLPKCERTWDEVSKTPTLYCGTLPTATDIPSAPGAAVQRGQPNTFVTYEDSDSWEAKMAYARSRGMAGAIIWAASDTGNGKSYGPDSTIDLFNGLFKGWFGQSVPLPLTTSVSPSPGSLMRWAEYPCPLALDYSKGMEVIDTSRCAGMTYSPLKTYFDVPKSASPSALGKDKILIHPIGDAEIPTGSPVVPSSSAFSASTAASSASTTTDGCTCVCPSVPGPTFPPASTHPTPTPPISTQPVPTAATSTRTMQPTTKSPKTAAPVTTTSAGENSLAEIISQCVAFFKAVPTWADYCGEGCTTFVSGPWCSGSSTGKKLADCVQIQRPYCVPA